VEAITNGPFTNRIQLIVDPFFGPFIQPGSPPVDFDPRVDLDVYVDGVLIPVQTFNYDALNNRYLLYMERAFDLSGFIQIISHVPNPPFMSGSGTFLPGDSGSGFSPAIFPAAATTTSFISHPTSGSFGETASFTASVVGQVQVMNTSLHSAGNNYLVGDTGYLNAGNHGAFYKIDSVAVLSSVSLKDSSSTGTTYGSSPQSATLPANFAPNAGDLLVAVLMYTSQTLSGGQYEPARSVTDDVGNVWVEALHLFNPNGAPVGYIPPPPAGEAISIWYCLSAKASLPTLTFTVTGANQNYALGCGYADYTGITAIGVDTTNTGSYGYPDVLNNPSISLTTSTKDYILAVFGESGGAGVGVVVPSAGFTNSFSGGGGHWSFAVTYKANTSPGSYSPGITGNFADNWMVAAVAFNFVGAGSVLTYHLTSYGSSYSSGTNVATVDSGTQPGICSGFTVDINSISNLTGNVEFSDESSPPVLLATTTLDGSGHAQFSTTSLSVGLHEIRVDYQGDSNYDASFAFVPYTVYAPSLQVGGFGLIASYSSTGDETLAPQVSLSAIPSVASIGESITLVCSTLNVANISLISNDSPPTVDTGIIPTSGFGILTVGSGFASTVTITLEAFDIDDNPIIIGVTPLTASVMVTIV